MVFLYDLKVVNAPRRDPLAEMIEKQGLKQGDVFILKSNTRSGEPKYDVCQVLAVGKGKDGYALQFSASKPGQISDKTGGSEGAYGLLESKSASKKGSDMNGFYIQKLREGQSVYLSDAENPAPKKAKIEKISISKPIRTSKSVDQVGIDITVDYGKGVRASIPANLVVSIEPIAVKAPEKKGF